MEKKLVKNFLRISHDADDELIEQLINTSKDFIKEQTGVEYDPKDTIYFHTVILLTAHLYDNRNFVTEKQVNSLPYSVDCFIKHIGMRDYNS